MARSSNRAKRWWDRCVIARSVSETKSTPKVQRVTAGTIHGTGVTIVISGPMSGRVITMATVGFVVGTSTTTTTTGRTLGASVNLVMSGVRATEKRAAGVRATGKRAAAMIVKDNSGRIILSSI